MGTTSIALALALAALAGLAAVLGWQPQRQGAQRTRNALLGLAAIASFCAYLQTPAREESGRLSVQRPALHTHEFFHYFLGTKYFSELGHPRLYEAVVIADFEDEPAQFRRDDRFRDLSTNVVDRIRGEVIAEGSLAKQHFSDERWIAFKEDVALIRSAFPSEAWHRGGLLRDHGYNGMPVSTLILGTLANQPFVNSYSFINIARWLDLLAMLLVGLLVASRIGAAPTLVFATLWFANPFNASAYVGGAYLRYGFALCLVLAWLAIERRRQAATGALLAVATHLRLFPFLFAVGLLTRDLLQPEPARALREHRPLYLSYVLSGLALIAVTAPVQGPDGRSAWLDSVERIAVHTTAYATNGAGLSAAFSWSGERDPELLEEAHERGEIRNWSDAVDKTVKSRRALHWSVLAVLLAGCVALARHSSPASALFLGFLLMFSLLYLSHYYFMPLGMLALIFRDDRRILLATTLGFGVLIATGTPVLFQDDTLRFSVLSVELGLFLAGIGVLAATRRAPEVAEA